MKVEDKVSLLVGDDPWDCCIVNDGCTPHVGDDSILYERILTACAPRVGDVPGSMRIDYGDVPRKSGMILQEDLSHKVNEPRRSGMSEAL